jgi:hypothetical protein
MSRRCWALLAGVSLVACSSSNGAAPGPIGADASMTSTDDGDGSVALPSMTATVGASGGTVQAGGAVLTIPAGALAGNVTITVTPNATAVPPEYTGLSPVFRFSPAGTMFAIPVTIALPLSMANPGATVFASNPGGDWTGLLTMTSGTTASAAVLQLSDFFAGVRQPGTDSGTTSEDAALADSGPTDAGTTTTSDASDGAVASEDSGPPDAGGSTDAAASDAGFEGITVSIDGVPTTFAVNPTLTYSSSTSSTVLQADDGTGSFWRFQLGVLSSASQQCSPFLQPTDPVITYTHYTAGVADTTFTTKVQGASCVVQASATATAAGEHTTGTFSGVLKQVVDGGTDAGGSHMITSGSYDVIF